MSAPVILTDDGPVRRLAISRPEKKNALTQAMYGALADGLNEADVTDAVRVVVIEGASGVFTAGNDIADFLAQNQADGAPANLLDTQVGRFLMALANFEKPLVAAVEGPAVGIGFTLLLHCDLVYVGDGAILKAPFVDLGLVPEAGSSALLPALVGHRKAYEIFVLGAGLSAQEAAALGLANAVTPTGEAASAAMDAARALAAKAPGALAKTKALMKRDQDAVRALIEEEGSHFGACLKSPEITEIMTAFLEKRAPKFAA